MKDAIPPPTCPQIDAAIKSLEDLRSINMQLRDGYYNEVERRESCEARVKVLEEALAPFLKACEWIDEEREDWYPVECYIQTGDLRRVRAELEGK